MSQPKKHTWQLPTSVFNAVPLKQADFMSDLGHKETGQGTRDPYDCEYELMLMYQELHHFMDDTWSDSEFHTSMYGQMPWVPQDPKQKQLVRLELERTNTSIIKLPLETKYYELTDAVPIDKRTKPLFIVCSPNLNHFKDIPNPLTTLQNFEGCENCDAHRDENDLLKFRYLFAVFPLPYRDLPEVPDDTAKLPRDSLFILCLNCLNERFVRVCGYREKYRELEWERPIEPAKYLPYSIMFGVHMRNALYDEAAPTQWNWKTPRELSPIPILTGFYTLANTIIPPMKKAANFQ